MQLFIIFFFWGGGGGGGGGVGGVQILISIETYMSHNLFSSKFLSFTIYSKTERIMAQLLP